ncbi:MAG: GNAT family N-acetyltransferase [Clostridia bacterium]|nr:GNAT family N-acetyltransferase [Clostridia bacterium]
MIFEQKEITLKNGKTAIFKTPDVEDAPKMLDYIKTACGETHFLLRYPEEWDSVTVEQEEKWVESSRNAPNNLTISCYIDGKVVGNCALTFLSGLKMSHRATVAIAIIREYWGLGIGSAMFREMIAAAQEHGTEILELEYIEGNDRARALYERFGFRVVGERPNAFKLKDGTLLKEFFMQKQMK